MVAKKCISYGVPDPVKFMRHSEFETVRHIVRARIGKPQLGQIEDLLGEMQNAAETMCDVRNICRPRKSAAGIRLRL